MTDMAVTDATFEDMVMKSDAPVLVDFWATWCGPCQMQAPIVEDVATEMTGKAKVVKMDVDENPMVAQQFGVMSIPTLMVFKGGQVVQQFIGVQGKDVLVSALNNALA